MKPSPPSAPRACPGSGGPRWPKTSSSSNGRPAAFTIVDLAICIAVVAFALVAIIGVMPTGLQVQRQNREDTIMAQEGKLWLEAIRSGALGIDYLTNYVDQIRVDTVRKLPQDTQYQHASNTYVYAGFAGGVGFRNGRDIVGLLSLPGYYEWGHAPSNFVLWATNTTAFVRTMTGSAAEKWADNEFALTYRLRSEVRQFSAVTGMNLDPDQAGLNEAQKEARRAAILRGAALRMNLYELRLILDWPVYQRGDRLEVGGNRKVFRTLVSGSLALTNVAYLDDRHLFFLQPSEFVLPQ